MRIVGVALAVCAAIVLAGSARAQGTGVVVPPPVAREFRGVWVATVDNMDWPSRPGLSTAQQQQELVDILDRAAALRLNAVILQVRPSADAMYASKFEPWSAFLTGRMGRAPSPAWDPLAFAVREAHARGLQLHAWFNPFRARYPGDDGPASASHVSRKLPAFVHRYGANQWIDPGSASARALALRVILDVVKRYDVDGIHLDDMFYPYPVNRNGRAVPFPDDATYGAYRKKGGTLARGDWRRHNVDLFVDSLYARVKRAKPWVLVGISPFGIWRPGNPPGIQGFDAYDNLYADSRKWLQRGWVDYLAPQLYWPIAQQGQAYPDLLQWWVQQDVQHRHLWPGNYAARVAGTSGSGPRWPASEIVRQVELTQQAAGADGNIFFSMSTLVADPDSLDQRLLAGPYAQPALVPASPWLSAAVPAAPTVRVSRPEAGAVRVRVAPGAGKSPGWWVVQARAGGAWHTMILAGAARDTTFRGAVGGASVVSVMAVSRTGIQGKPSVVTFNTSPGDVPHEHHPAPESR